jgi:phospholipid transport system transporter-binding protein
MLALPAVLTHTQAGPCLAQLAADIAKGPQHVVLNAQALQDFDSSALAVLLELRRACLRLGKQLQIEGAPARLMHLASLYGVSALLQDRAQVGTDTEASAPV